jgi:polyprenyl-phospho-N-acetylgalactosaminyl synthase
LTGPKHSVSVIIPAYFEENTINSVVQKCIPFASEVIVINDGSSDDTSLNAELAGAKVIEMVENQGVVRAIQRGLLEASGDIIVTLDADGQHDPSEIPLLIQPIIDNRAELVVGKRPTFPYFSERILTKLTNLRVPCKDASSGFRAVKNNIAKKMKLTGECLCGIFILEAAKHGASITSVPISIHEREGPRRIQTNHLKQFFIVLKTVLLFKKDI